MSEVIGFLLADENLIFTLSLSLVFAFFVIECIGLAVGSTMIGEFDADADVDASADFDGANAFGGFFRWLGVGKVPLIIFLVTFFGIFGLTGLILNWISHIFLGTLVGPLLMAPIALVAGLPFIRIVNSLIVRFFPHDHTNAVSLVDLVGNKAVITVGTATATSPAEFRTVDAHKVSHYGRAIPIDPAAEYRSGTTVVLVKYDDSTKLFHVTHEA